MRKINISNDSRRDAEVAFGGSAKRQAPIYRTVDGDSTTSERRLKATIPTDDSTLIARYGDGLADALISGDPEVDMERDGLKLLGLKKVYLTAEKKVAYGVTLAEHLHSADGSEKGVRPIATTSGNIAIDGMPIRWTGKMVPKRVAMRKFIFKRSYQMQHVNGLTYDFLFAMAKKLSDAKAMMLVGGGPKGVGPLVMSNGGTPYRAFLEGRVDGDKYALILRLTNLELKAIPQTTKE